MLEAVFNNKVPVMGGLTILTIELYRYTDAVK